MGAITLRNVEKAYGHGPKANKVIHGVNAEISDGEFIVIVGPSGCGKSTLLRMVAGLEDISSGEIEIGGRVAAGDHAFDAHHHRVHVFAGGHEQGPQVLVPAVDELNDKQRSN